MTVSKAFGSEHVAKPHLIKPQGGVAAEIWDLRVDLERAFSKAEGRPAASHYPELSMVDGSIPPLTGGDMVLRGTYLIQGQTFASLALFLTTSKLTFTALKPGVGGNDLTIAIVHAGGAPAVTVAKVANAITITANLGVHTANDIATAINVNGADTDGYVRCLSGGAGVTITATAATHLAGGEGEGWTCTISGAECLPANTPGTAGAAALTETLCTVTVPDLTALAPPRTSSDMLPIVISSDGVLTATIVSSAGIASAAALTGVVDPNGAVTGFFGQLYYDSTADIWYQCHSAPSGTAWDTVAQRDWVTALVIAGVNWREVLLSPLQLIDGAAGGVAPAMVISVTGLPTIGDTIVLKNGAVTETYLVQAGHVNPFDVVQGANFDDFMTNLVTEIMARSTVWNAERTNGLDRFFAGVPTNQVVVSLKVANNTDLSRTYGTLTGAGACRIVNFLGNANYDLSAGVEAALPAADSAARQFGFGRPFASLMSGETHNTLSVDAGYTWDPDTRVWNRTMMVGYTQAQLNSTTGGSEGASLIGTDNKANLGNSTTTEACLTNLDTKNPPARSSGVASPIGVVAGAVGDLYVDTVTDVAYVNTDGTVNGWVVTGSASLVYDPGVIPTVSIVHTGQPAIGNTLVIGADTYEFDGVGANINVAIGGSAEISYDTLIAESIAHGTANVVFDKISATQVRIRAADAPNGTPLASDPNLAITENLANALVSTAGHGVLGNFNTLAGRAAGIKRSDTATLTITTAMIAVGVARISFPWAVTDYIITYLTAAGVVRLPGADTAAIDSGDVLLTLHGAGGDLANTDIVRVIVTF